MDIAFAYQNSQANLGDIRVANTKTTNTTITVYRLNEESLED